MATLYSELFAIINKGGIDVKISTKVLTSKCGFQKAMVIMDPFLNNTTPWFVISKVMNGGE